MVFVDFVRQLRQETRPEQWIQAWAFEDVGRVILNGAEENLEETA